MRSLIPWVCSRVSLCRDRVLRPAPESQTSLARLFGCFGKRGSASRFPAPLAVESAGSHLQIACGALLRSHCVVVAAKLQTKRVSR